MTSEEKEQTLELLRLIKLIAEAHPEYTMADILAMVAPKLTPLTQEDKKMNIETKEYSDGTSATGVAPLPDLSPAQQDAAKLNLDPESTGNKHIDDIFKRLARLENLDILNHTIDHVNREIGVAQDVPLHVRLAELQQYCDKNFGKIKEKFNY